MEAYAVLETGGKQVLVKAGDKIEIEKLSVDPGQEAVLDTVCAVSDGIDIEMTKNVLVENCRFDQGDDVIVVKSGRNRDAWRLGTPSENIEIRNCVVTGGHTLLGIGSELSGGVRDVYLHDCTCEGEVLRLFYVKTK